MNEHDSGVKAALKFRPNNFENNFLLNNKKTHYLNSFNDNNNNRETFKSTNSINFNQSNKVNNVLKRNENLKNYYVRNANEIEIFDSTLNNKVKSCLKAPSGKPPISPRSIQNFNINNNQSMSISNLSHKFNNSNNKSVINENQSAMYSRSKSREKISNSQNNLETLYDNLDEFRSDEFRNRFLPSVSSNSSQTSSVFLDRPTRISDLTEEANPLTMDNQINRGVVQNLKKKFATSIKTAPLTTDTTPMRLKKQPETIKSYQLKKCQSVMFDLNEDLAESANNPTENNLNKREKITSSTGNLFDTNNSKNKLEEMSVFENVDIKSKINKFSTNQSSHLDNPKSIKKIIGINNKLNNEEVKNVSCLNLKKLRINTNGSNTSDDEFSTFSDDLTNSNENYKTLSRFKSETNVLDNSTIPNGNELNAKEKRKKNGSSEFLSQSMNCISSKILNSTNFDPVKFDENYKKIKEAFTDLKKDNELIESLLTDMRNKVKETTESFSTSSLSSSSTSSSSAPNNYDNLEIYENYFNLKNDQENVSPLLERKKFTSISSLVPAVVKMSKRNFEDTQFIIKHKF